MDRKIEKLSSVTTSLLYHFDVLADVLSPRKFPAGPGKIRLELRASSLKGQPEKGSCDAVSGLHITEFRSMISQESKLPSQPKRLTTSFSCFRCAGLRSNNVLTHCALRPARRSLAAHFVFHVFTKSLSPTVMLAYTKEIALGAFLMEPAAAVFRFHSLSLQRTYSSSTSH